MKVALTTVLDDKYLPGFLITLNSMLECSDKIEHDLIILEWGELSEQSKNVIKLLYPRAIFKMVDVKAYDTHEYDTTWRRWTYNCNYRFDIFSFVEYDRVIFFDCDFLFQIDINEVINFNVDFGACPATKDQVLQINRAVGFDGGLLSVGKKFLTPQTKEALIKIATSSPPYDKKVKTNKWTSDEPILNTFFLDKITWLDTKYNIGTDRITKEWFNTPHNIQYIGHNKPWYGTDIGDQFDSFIFKSLTATCGAYMVPLILQQLLKTYKKQINSLKQKNIDVLKYSGLISPRRD